MHDCCCVLLVSVWFRDHHPSTDFSVVLIFGDLQLADPYVGKLKGVSACFTALSHALTGRYVNFGVFKLYNDPALSNCLQVVVHLAQQITREDLMQVSFCSAFAGCVLSVD